MNQFVSHMILAVDPTNLWQRWQWDTPDSILVWVVILTLIPAYLAWFFYMSLVDSRSLNPFWRFWLVLLRLAVLAGLLVILFNPQLKSQKQVYHPSKVGILVDTSLSMGFPATDPVDSPAEAKQTRLEAIRKVLFDEELVAKLRETHEVSVFTFDSQLKGPVHVYSSQHPLARGAALTAGENRETPSESEDSSLSLEAQLLKSAGSRRDQEGGTSSSASAPTWDDAFPAAGAETRVAESVNAALTQLGGHLSGLIVLTDGASNAGLQASSANAAAKDLDARLVAIGFGSTRKPVNLAVESVQAPSLVRLSDQPGEVNDTYDVVALIQGSGLKGKTADVELLLKPKDDPDAEPVLIESQPVTFAEDEERIELKFEREPAVEGREEYIVRATPSELVGEINKEDNTGKRTVTITRKRMELLIVAGGPMRDYRFLRSMLARRSGIEMDIWLQTVEPNVAAAVDQDARQLLTQFPQTAEELSRYDVIIAFDPDWRRLAPEQVQFLSEWVATHAGGMIYVAGDVFTGELSTIGNVADSPEAQDYKPVLDLLPVHLALRGFEIVSTISSDTGFPIEFTKDGEQAGFLQLEEDPGASKMVWDKFPGIYRCYPTSGAKPAATVYAYYSDPRFVSKEGQPILLASQFYGAGRVLYLGSAELWRIRGISDEYFDRFFIRAIREVAQGRMKQGNQRLLLMPERKNYYLRQTVRVRARVFDRQLNPLQAPNVTMRVYEPDGREMVPAIKLPKDANRAGEYVADFVVTKRGTYRLELIDPEDPESVDKSSVETEEIEVTVPRLESENTQQNVKYLRDLVVDTSGEYVPPETAPEVVPTLLTDSGEEVAVDVSSRPLWDKAWVMYLLIGLLSLEWLTRKLLKLA